LEKALTSAGISALESLSVSLFSVSSLDSALSGVASESAVLSSCVDTGVGVGVVDAWFSA